MNQVRLTAPTLPPPCYDHGATQPRALTLLLADPQPVVRAGLVAALTPHPRMEVAATVASAPDLWTALRDVSADVVIANPLLLGATPAQAIARLQRDDPSRRLVLFTPQPDLAVALLPHGALGAVAMDEPLEYLVTAVLAAGAGQRFVSPGVQTWADRYRLAAGVARLAPRELEVLALLARGYSTAELAGALGMEESTVYNYIMKLKTKLGCANRVQLVAWYRRMYRP